MIKKLEQSLKAIQEFPLKPHHYLQVVGIGENQHLEVVRKTWLGRILMWLGFTCACMKKVAAFVEANASTLFLYATSSQKTSLNALTEKISRSRHLKKSPEIIARINNISKPIKTSTVDRMADKEKSLTHIQHTLKRVKSTLKLGLAPEEPPMPCMPQASPGQPQELKAIFLRQEFQNACKEGLAGVNDFFIKYIDKLNPYSEPLNGPKYAYRMGIIVGEMTKELIEKFVQDTTLFDIFHIREETVCFPSPRLIGVVSLMTPEQLKTMVETIAKSDKWDIVYLRDAFLKISSILPKSPLGSKMFASVVQQPRFFDTNIKQISAIPNSTDAMERQWEEAEFASDAVLSAYYVHNILNRTDRDEKLREFIEFKCAADNEGSLIKAHPFLKHVDKNSKNFFLATLPKKDQYQLGNFLVQKFAPNVWKDSLLIQTLINDATFTRPLLEKIKDNNVRNILIEMCKNIGLLDKLNFDTEQFDPPLTLLVLSNHLYNLKTERIVEAERIAEANRQEALRLKARNEAKKAALNLPKLNLNLGPHPSAAVLLTHSPRRLD